MSFPAVRLALLLTITSCLIFGCGSGHSDQQLRTKAADRSSGPKRTSTPHPNPRVDEILKQHTMGDAEELLQTADILKAQSDFAEAEAHYLAALKMRPKLTMATYQLACNYALWGRKEQALETLKKAVDAGFWGYAMMKDDEDLVNIRQAPDYQGLLEKVKERYAVQAPKQVGGSLLVLPDNDVPKSGWPVLVILHGFGDCKENYQSMAQNAAEHGFAGIAVSGPLVLFERRFGWPTDSFESTHRFLTEQLQKYDEKSLDRSRVFLLGFSQGAEHAAALTALHPDVYAGAIVLSPGGQPGPNLATRAKNPARPLYLTFGVREPAGNRDLAKHWADDWRKAGWPVREEEHKGGHHFPTDWDEQFPKVLEWLRNGT
jgi:predicted esterase